MDNNCLVRILEGTVNNDNLDRVGELKCSIDLNGKMIPRVSIISSEEELLVTLIDDGVTFSSATSPSEIIDSKHAILSNVYGGELYVTGVDDNATINVFVKSKYKLTALTSRINNYSLDKIAYSTELTSIKAPDGGNITGALKDLEELSSLSVLHMGFPRFSDVISNLGKNTALTELYVPSGEASGQITGNWETFVESQRTNTRTTCSSGITLKGLYITPYIGFGNRSDARVGGSAEDGTLKWDASKISLQFDTSKKVLTIGYTQGEAEAAFPTYEVILCD